MPGPGRMLRRSVSCTGAGWWTSGARRRQTVWWDMWWVWGVKDIGQTVSIKDSWIQQTNKNAIGNDIGLTGVWTHARDNTDVIWFANVRTCVNGNQQESRGGDAIEFYAGVCPRVYNGAYCDRPSSTNLKFICEGLIWFYWLKWPSGKAHCTVFSSFFLVGFGLIACNKPDLTWAWEQVPFQALPCLKSPQKSPLESPSKSTLNTFLKFPWSIPQPL